jgi:hypothetical protein
VLSIDPDLVGRPESWLQFHTRYPLSFGCTVVVGQGQLSERSFYQVHTEATATPQTAMVELETFRWWMTHDGVAR